MEKQIHVSGVRADASAPAPGCVGDDVPLGCLAAALLGYGVGMVLYQSLGTWFIDTMGMQSAYQAYQGFFDQYGFIAILTLGILPIPFQVAMITAGLSGYPIALFVLAALIARGIQERKPSLGPSTLHVNTFRLLSCLS